MKAEAARIAAEAFAVAPQVCTHALLLCIYLPAEALSAHAHVRQRVHKPSESCHCKSMTNLPQLCGLPIMSAYMCAGRPRPC